MATVFEKWKIELEQKYITTDPELLGEFFEQLKIYLKNSEQATIVDIRNAAFHASEALERVDWPREFTESEMEAIFLASEAALKSSEVKNAEPALRERLPIEVFKRPEVPDEILENDDGTVEGFNIHPAYRRQ